MTSQAEVRLWGRRIGVVAWDAERRCGAFEYEPKFVQSGIQLAPLKMPLSKRIYEFPELAFPTFHGLPGLLADSLPDKFGNALIDTWLARQGRKPESFSPIERLCYTGKRGMGALEYFPATGPKQRRAKKIEIDALVDLASEILSQRQRVSASLADQNKCQALKDLLSIGTSAGGARAKAVIAWNLATNEVKSGQVDAGSGYSYWLIKFDGVKANKDKELDDPKGYGVIEYAYSLMAKAAGITMSECRLLEENGRRHFMTKRFDRLDDGGKLHMQSLCALGHYDFNSPGAYGYEQALDAIKQLDMPKQVVEEQFRRMTFNLVARNQDDHVKNIAFLMNKAGVWSLAPAFDVTYSYNPAGKFTSTQQMTMNGKRDGFTIEDFRACANSAQLKRGRAEMILAEVTAAVERWNDFAEETGVEPTKARKIGSTFRLKMPRR